MSNPPVVLGVVFTWVIFSLAFLVAIAPVALFWAWTERGRRHGWKTAAAWGGLLGALCSAAPFAALLNAFLRKYGGTPGLAISAVSFPTPLIVFAIACPVIGCLVALATWRFAYRRESERGLVDVFS